MSSEVCDRPAQLQNLEMFDIKSIGIILSQQRITKTLIRLRMHRLICIFVCIWYKQVFSWQGSNEADHSKTYIITCIANEDSDQPEYPHSLARVLKLLVLGLATNTALPEDCKDVPGWTRFGSFTVMILSFLTDRSGQTVQTQTLRSSLIRVYTVCQFPLHLFDALFYGKTTLFKF